jgi:hypothetical protein
MGNCIAVLPNLSECVALKTINVSFNPLATRFEP